MAERADSSQGLILCNAKQPGKAWPKLALAAEIVEQMKSTPQGKNEETSVIFNEIWRRE
ncbi:hypothetical protein [Mesorhizobium sp. WSM3626]|uniref:hypothetical protein n=1 Tax=Mesorhizobium sp. WSM3626 TaxID=1040987 RepID=UPI0012EC63E0|nr:hypothetical protein [Mesorhizobium sp. WSM3626]